MINASSIIIGKFCIPFTFSMFQWLVCESLYIICFKPVHNCLRYKEAMGPMKTKRREKLNGITKEYSEVLKQVVH